MICTKGKLDIISNSITYFIELYDVGMSNNLENMDFSRYSLNVWLILDLVFLQNFDSNFLTRY